MNNMLDDPYWTLDQTVAWARSRNEEVVRFALSHGGIALEVKINVEARKAMKDGHDIEGELWKAIGREKPQDVPLSSFGEDPITVTWQDNKGGQLSDTLTHIAGDHFPINEHVQRLLQSGKLVAYGRIDGETVNRKIEGAEWHGLQITEDRTGCRVVTRGGCVGEVIRDVRIDRDLVVATFPAVIAADGVTRPPELKQEQVTLARKRGRKPAIDWEGVDKEVFRLMDHHGNFVAGDPDWNCQACLERAIADFLYDHYRDGAPKETAIREHVSKALDQWRQGKVAN